jgi:HD-GYP domain-containing protein (c-di-GMP phosphodiesterase class II)
MRGVDLKLHPHIRQVPVEQLRIGAYVSALDRPWIETPFLFQGFTIETEDDLKQLRALCTTVFIEVQEEGAQDIPAERARSSSVPDRSPLIPRELTPSLVRRLEHRVVQDPVPLKNELSRAQTVYHGAREGVAQLFERLRRGGGLDIPHLKEVVDSMVDSVFRNREAMSWLAQMKSTDDYLYSHSLGTAVWALALGRHLGLDRNSLRSLGVGAMLLDIGKTRLPIELLNGREQLTDEQWKQVRGHVDESQGLARSVEGVDMEVMDMIRTHHERFDGTGYPRQLQGSEIPMLGRIAGIVDCYDAMISQRPHAPARSTYDAVRELKRLSGSWFQPELVELFVQAVGVFPPGSLVELNTGEVAVVVAQNRFRRLRPQIMIVLGADRQPAADFTTLDLNTCDANTASDQPGLWISKGLEPGSFGIDPNEYFL